MAWVAKNKCGEEYVYESEPYRKGDIWVIYDWSDAVVQLPKGSIEKLTGSPMSWDDEPREVK